VSAASPANTAVHASLAPTPAHVPAAVQVHPSPASSAVAAPANSAHAGASLAGASTSLAAQNDRFAQAMGQKRAGDLSGADATLETLLRDHPGGPLAESALVERMRIVSRMDRARGKDLAAVYLRRHPQGAARVEAERLIAGEP